MEFTKQTIDPAVQARLRKMAAEMRSPLYGEAGYREWGTKFAPIEAEGMTVCFDLARFGLTQEARARGEGHTAWSSCDASVWEASGKTASN